ncbi:vacuolar protein sorting-associated protein 13B isoform X2 [Cimex lectularius]|uniref:Chorein N-terminal domain-containing protein n=1 Tax=Cimex lectularius TaxID=79782 RepID=A0A8I6TIP6_CIMLE|nr:vacuolar protein sorting-associated protein 13B isoform X2 [Cimex lectularius]
MFRIDSYITSVILSYVDKYVKNFKRQDAQVSLWEGDGSLHNLDLDLEVLDQELNLPFSLVSGHIHELLIHVPWTRIASEPVQITINTIECVMKLKPPGQVMGLKKASKKKKKTGSTEESGPPPSYVSTLINKIVFNMSVTCNNLILKYVEEDIVLSMNIKTLSLKTVNSNWTPEFSDLNLTQLILRNLVTFTDVTICLDKRNASGRIESYLEPILYKCSLTVRLSRTFPSPTATSATTTRVGIQCENVTLCISEPQVSMLLRLAMMVKMMLNSPKVTPTPSQQSVEANQADNNSPTLPEEVPVESWSSWMWGFMPSLFPIASEGQTIDTVVNRKTHLGFYVNDFILDLKLVDEGKTWESLMKLQFKGLFAEISTSSNDWVNFQLGICLITVHPIPQIENETYLSCGEIEPQLKNSTLFEKPDVDLPQRAWDVHLSTVTENYMVSRAPAFAMDYLASMEVPMNSWNDNFLSDPRERVLVRYVVGPIKVNVTTGLLNRVAVITQAASYSDYPLYQQFYFNSNAISADDIQTVLRTEPKYFSETYIPKQITQFTICEATVRIFCAQITVPGKKGKKSFAPEILNTNNNKQPQLVLKLKTLDGSFTNPLNPDKLQGLTLRTNTTTEIFSDAMTTLSAGVIKLSASVVIGDMEFEDLLEIHKLSTTLAYNCLLITDLDSVSRHCTVQIGEIKFSSSNSKLMLGLCIIDSFLKKKVSANPIYTTTLVQDSLMTTGYPFLNLSVNAIHFMFVQSKVNESLKIRVGNMSGFTFYPEEKQKQQYSILTAGTKTTQNVCEGIAQRPISMNSAAPFLLYIKVRQFQINLEKAMFDWLTYTPRPFIQGGTIYHLDSTGKISSSSYKSAVSRKISSSSLSSNSKKPGDILEMLEKPILAVEKEAEPAPVQKSTSSTALENCEKKINEIVKWFSLVVCGEFSDIGLTYTSSSKSAYIMVTKIPSIMVTSTYGKITVDSDELPMMLNNWKRDASSLPWTINISGINGYGTADGKVKEVFIEPFSINCTVAVTSKFAIPTSAVNVTIHIDTSNVNTIFGKQQMMAIAELLTLVHQVLNAFAVKFAGSSPDDIALDFLQNSDESYSINQPNIQSKDNSPMLKFSCWLQWTMAKFTMSFLTTPSKSNTEILKLVLELEDIILSADMDLNDNVYQKIKMKVGTAGIRHYFRESKKMPWRMGAFSGVMMRVHESSASNSEFLALTLTRALATSYHAKISKSTYNLKESSLPKASANTYVVEIDLKLEPLDFVLSPIVLCKFLKVVEPVIYRKEVVGPPPGAPLDQLTTADLPLIYLDVQQIRAFFPASLLPQDSSQQDSIIIHIDHIALRHEAVNPVSRKILRSDIYTSAQRARMTTLPGSHLEDRQYQLDFTVQISTGCWQELAPHVSGEEEGRLDNPAVYWNSGGGPSIHKGARLTPLLTSVKTCLILAPPIVTSGFVISGLNFEANIISDVDMTLSLEQLRLIKCLVNECKSLVPESLESPPPELPVDSGIESVEGSIISHMTRQKEPLARTGSTSLISTVSSTAVNTKGLRHRTQTVPTDVLLIAKGISVKVYSQHGVSSQPLVYFMLSQPFVSLEKHGDTCVYKGSVFDAGVKIGMSGHFIKGRVEVDHFPVVLAATKEGDPDPYKGIPPALANFKATRVGMKLPIVEIELGRPLKFTGKMSSIEFLTNLKDNVFQILEIHPLLQENVERILSEKRSERQLKISALNVSTKQIALDLVIDQPKKKNVIMSISSMSGSLNFPTLNQIYGNLKMQSVILSIPRRGHSIILNPWSFNLVGNLTWEPWMANPLFTIQLTSDILIVEYSYTQIQALVHIFNEFKPLFKSKPKEEEATFEDETKSIKSEGEEQLYKDDLQAGVFQFVNSTPQPELPLAYQVIFPTENQMSWAYPQPRSITSVTVLPIPFKRSVSEGVPVVLQYLDFLGWKDWVHFKLSETKIVEVKLPTKPQVAGTWRVVITSAKSPVNIQALVAALRVDSLFSARLVPNIRLNISIDTAQISAWAGPSSPVSLPPALLRYCPDTSTPGEYAFARLSFEQVKARILLWKNGQLEIEGDCNPKLNILNSLTLQEQCCVKKFPLHFNFEMDSQADLRPQQNLSVLVGPVLVYIAPSITHTLTAALNDAILKPFVVCNDTCYPFRIGQQGTNEDITIQCLQCHFYSWRSIHHTMCMRFSASLQGNDFWSHHISIHPDQCQRIFLKDDTGKQLCVLIIVKKLSSTITQILITGELIVHNNLEKSIDVRLVASTIQERQKYLTINPNVRSPSIILTPDIKYNLRLALEGQWSGLVPLFATSNSWLVKVPTENKTDYNSIWCQIFRDKKHGSRMMVVLSPMYFVKSHLPCDANVLVKTAELNKINSAKISGRGSTSNLFTPGTTQHSHSLTFHIEGNQPSSSPHVPLSYSAMDGKTPPLPPIPNVDVLLERSEILYCGSKWPFLGPHWSRVTWKHTNQPDTITHVKVRFCADKLKVSNSLLVELQPWALAINTLGLNITLQSSSKFLCALGNFSVLAPPPIDEMFYILVELNDGYHKSNGLQLSDSKMFYTPEVAGLIPQTANVKIKIQAPNSVILATFHSKMISGIRVLHISSSIVITNLTDYDLSVAAFSVRKDTSGKYRVPSEILSYAISLPKQNPDNVFAEPLAEWHEIGHGSEASRNLYLIFEHKGLISSPVQVDLGGLEMSVSAALLPIAGQPEINKVLNVIFQLKDGITYIIVNAQNTPRLVVHNRTRYLLALGKSATDEGGKAVEESSDWEWNFMLPAGKCGHYKPPPCNAPLGTPLPPIVVTRPDTMCWSSAISLIPSTGSRLVNLPQSQDLTASVMRIGYTTHLILAHANHSLISASDVRSRLSLNLNANTDKFHLNSQEEKVPESPTTHEECNSCEDIEQLKNSVLRTFHFTSYIDGITIMLCSETEGSFIWKEFTALSLDNVGITLEPNLNPNTEITELFLGVTIWDLQLDNQEFQYGGYDFSVVLLRQGESDKSIFIGKDPAHLVKTSKENNPAIDMTVVLNTGVQNVIQEINVQAAPLQVYIENNYFTNLMNHISNLYPTLLITAGKQINVESNSPSKSLKTVNTSLCSINNNSEKANGENSVILCEESEPSSFTPWDSVNPIIEDSKDDLDYEDTCWPELPEDPQSKVPVPPEIVLSALEITRPLQLRAFNLSPVDVLVSVHTSTMFYIALDQSPLYFSEFCKSDMVTTMYRLGQALTLHYFLGAIYGTGWAIGSLQLLGAPAGLARSFGHGLKSFITLPYLGMMQGPTGFLSGVINGSASLMRHITAGTLTSVNKLAESWSRTLDRLTLSDDDLKIAEEMRRIKPQGIAEGLKQGLTEFGVSILGGVGGLAQQPLDYATGSQDKTFVGSLSRGIVGVMARPISGAAELVARTTHGILSGAGWADQHMPKHQAICQGVHPGNESAAKYVNQLVSKMETILLVCEATSSDYEPVVLVISSLNLYVISKEDAIHKVLMLNDVIGNRDKFDPTMIRISTQTPDKVAEKLSQKRITEFVRETQRALNTSGIEESLPPTPPSVEIDPFVYYINPQWRDYFMSVLELAIRHASQKGFPILN